MDLRVSTSARAAGAAIVVRLEGEITIETQAVLSRRLEEFIEGAAASELILDLSGVPYIDSSGLGALIHASRACRNRQIPFALGGVSPLLRRYFTMTGLQRAFRFIDVPEEELRE